MSTPAKKSKFYDFVSRYVATDFETYLANSTEDSDYINWHHYCLPFVYDNEEKEYNAVRNGCALFDASPVKKYRIRGSDAGAFMDYVMTRSMSKLPVMRATYAIWCTENGMLDDDALLYKLAEDDYLLMVADRNHDDHFNNCKQKFGDVIITEETPSLAGFAVQGPKSCAVLNSFGFTGIENLEPFDIKFFNFAGGEVMVSRVGFTADLGYEIWFKPELCNAIEEVFIAAEKTVGIQIAGYGLTAIQLCRMEGGMIVPGWDTGPTLERSPAELAMAWNVDLERAEDFVGKAALLKEKTNGPRYKMTGFEIDSDCVVPTGAELFTTVNSQTTQIGVLPSVSWSYNTKRWIGLASIETAYANTIDSFIKVDGEKITCRICSIPFVKLARRTQVPAPL